MVEFRPHTLSVLRVSGSYDANGDYVPEAEQVAFTAPCRYEPNGSARTIQLQDGTAYAYAYTVYLDVDLTHDIRFGDILELRDAQGVSIGRYPVKGFHRGQLNEKIWV